MDEKNKIVYFDKMYVGKNNEFLLSSKMEEIFQFFKARQYDKIKEIEISSKHLYVSAMERFDLRDDIDSSTREVTKQHAYMLNIASVDPNEEIKYADLDKRIDQRKIVVTDDEDEKEADHLGPLLDTQIVIDPFRMVMASCRGTGRLTKWELKKFLKKLLNTKALSFDVILNKKGLLDVKNMTSRTSFTYSIASPDHFKEFKNDSGSEKLDMKFVNYMRGKNFKITVESENIPWTKLKQKISQLNKQNEVNSIKIEGINDGIEEKVDLLKNKLTHKGTILFDNVIMIKDFFDMLEQSYKEEYNFIFNTFEIEKKVVKGSEEGENQ